MTRMQIKLMKDGGGDKGEWWRLVGDYERGVEVTGEQWRRLECPYLRLHHLDVLGRRCEGEAQP